MRDEIKKELLDGLLQQVQDVDELAHGRAVAGFRHLVKRLLRVRRSLSSRKPRLQVTDLNRE